MNAERYTAILMAKQTRPLSVTMSSMAWLERSALAFSGRLKTPITRTQTLGVPNARNE